VPRQVLLLSRTVIGCLQPYVGRFACDWHRLASRGGAHAHLSG